MLLPSVVNCAIALQHSKWLEAARELAAKEKALGLILNVAQRWPDGWPP
jgi:hypothetical protein